MKEEGDVFKKFRDSFSRMEGHFHILEPVSYTHLDVYKRQPYNWI